LDRRSFGRIVIGGAIGNLAACGGQDSTFATAEITKRFDVASFGAAGNGIADDTKAFEAALSLAAATTGTVTIPIGRFRLSNTLRVASGVTFAGQGIRSVLAPIDGLPIVLVSTLTKNVAFRDFAIQGRYAHGLHLVQTSGALVAGCHFSGATIARDGTASGVYITASNDVIVSGCRFEGNGTDDTFPTSDFLCDGLGGTSRNIHFIENQCLSTKVAFNFRAHDLALSEIRGNLIRGARLRGEHNHGYGIMIYPTSRGLTASFGNVIAENDIAQTDGAGIYLVRSSSTTLEHNIIDDVARVQLDHTEPVGAIALNRCENMIVQENEMYRSGRCGIVMSTTENGVGDIVVRANKVVGAAGFGIQIRGAMHRISVLGNTVSQTNGGIGAYNYEAQSDIRISANTIDDIVEHPGIWLGNAGASRVDNNVISRCAGYAMDLAFSDEESVAAGNVVETAASAANSISNRVLITRLKPKGG
jgi:parallel beta-helix repeat protein